MRASFYREETDRWETRRFFLCQACYDKLLAKGLVEDLAPTLMEEDAGYYCEECGATTEG